ncbi:hypothetical protein HMPREF9418_0810 [Neisseria macacae ATCC 33926]|uniref:Uncharacterized protein n=1 Tax=Neisseria macacae ATCC 33926 TaxID=997348 RepID=A0AA36UKI6_9NEIS|nr:hypothetical protein HMPREF9418_0810 [Neisseria macacae ATCC 33926]
MLHRFIPYFWTSIIFLLYPVPQATQSKSDGLFPLYSSSPHNKVSDDP